jgi:hypothetical protein
MLGLEAGRLAGTVLGIVVLGVLGNFGLRLWLRMIVGRLVALVSRSDLMLAELASLTIGRVTVARRGAICDRISCDCAVCILAASSSHPPASRAAANTSIAA